MCKQRCRAMPIKLVEVTAGDQEGAARALRGWGVLIANCARTKVTDQLRESQRPSADGT